MSGAFAKPRGVQHVNRADPFGRLMTSGWLFNGPSVSTGVCERDICGRSHLNALSMTGNPFSYVSSPYGTVLDRAGTANTDTMIFTGPVGNIVIPSTPTFTIVTRMFLRALPNYSNVFTFGSASGFFIRGILSGTEAKMDFFQGGENVAVTALLANTWISVAVQCLKGVISYFYYDPVVGFTGDPGNPFANTIAGGFTINNMFSDSGSEYFNGQPDYFYYFGTTAIPQKSLELLMADPYRVVRRRNVALLKASGVAAARQQTLTLLGMGA